MSKVLICSMRFLQDNTWNGRHHIFEGHRCDPRKNSRKIFKQCDLKKSVCYQEDACVAISAIMGMTAENNPDKVLELAKSVDTERYGHEFLQEDIENNDTSFIIQDLYEIFRDNYKTDIVNDITYLHEPECYCLHDPKNDISAYAISILPYKQAGLGFYNEWVDALIEDFTKRGDEVIIALHSSTDYKDINQCNTYLAEESRILSQKYNDRLNKIRLHVFSHQEGSGYVKETLCLKELADIWEVLSKETLEEIRKTLISLCQEKQK